MIHRFPWKLFVVVFAACFLGAWWSFAPGSLELLAPCDSELVVVINGGEPVTLKAGEHRSVWLPRGHPSVTMQTRGTSGTQAFDVTSGMDWFLAAAPGQKLLLVDLVSGNASAIYPNESRAGDGTYLFPERDLPEKVPANQKVFAVRDSQCLEK